MRDFKGKVVVVTGAGSGIGRALAQNFCELGSTTVLTDIDADRLAKVEEDLQKRGGKVSVHKVDAGSEKAMKKFAKTALEEHGHVDVVINNAAIGIGGELVKTTLQDFRRLMDVNFWGVVYGVNFFAPQMIEQGSGHIVNIASINGIVPFPFNGPYNTSKFAVMGYTKTLRMELDPKGVGVTVVCPGLIRTNIVKDRQHGAESNETMEHLANIFEKRMEEKGADPMTLAVAIQGAIEKNQGVLLYPFDSVFLRWFAAHFPQRYEDLSLRMMEGKGETIPLGGVGFSIFSALSKRLSR